MVGLVRPPGVVRRSRLHCGARGALTRDRFRFVDREIAKGLERAVSTVGREVARHGGRPAYRASQADDAAVGLAAHALPSVH